MTRSSYTLITVKPTPDITSEQAHDVRARAWRFVFDCYEKTKGGPETAPDDVMKGSKDDRNKISIQE